MPHVGRLSQRSQVRVWNPPLGGWFPRCVASIKGADLLPHRRLTTVPFSQSNTCLRSPLNLSFAITSNNANIMSIGNGPSARAGSSSKRPSSSKKKTKKGKAQAKENAFTRPSTSLPTPPTTPKDKDVPNIPTTSPAEGAGEEQVPKTGEELGTKDKEEYYEVFLGRLYQFGKAAESVSRASRPNTLSSTASGTADPVGCRGRKELGTDRQDGSGANLVIVERRKDEASK